MTAIANSTVPDGSTEHWRDRKRRLWLIGLVVPSLAFLGYGGWQLTGLGAWFWIGPVVILVVVPTIDLVAGLDRSNPPDDVIEALENDRYYRWITYLFLPIQYAAFVGAMYLIAVGDPLGGESLALWEKVGLAISIGCIGGIGINTAHELGHKKESHERWLSKIALAPVFYGHFYIEHNRGHHVRVATPEDPASARLGENFYQFWPRTVWGSLQERVAAGEASLRPQAPAPVPDRQRRPQRLADDAGALGCGDGLARRRAAALPGDPGDRRLLAARGRQLHGALRDAAPEGGRRRAAALRAGRPQPQLELQQHRDQRAALPPAAPQRPPRQPHPPLPGAARLRGEPGAADRVRRDDRARHRPARCGAGSWTPACWPTSAATSRGPTSVPASARRSWRRTAPVVLEAEHDGGRRTVEAPPSRPR